MRPTTANPEGPYAKGEPFNSRPTPYEGLITSVLIVVIAVAVIVVTISINTAKGEIENGGNLIVNSTAFSLNRQTTTGSNTATVASLPPAPVDLKDTYPQTVGVFALQNTYERVELKGDDEFLPGAIDVVGAVYKSSANKKEQVMVGSYSSHAKAEAARISRVRPSKYIARWTRGDLLFVATNAYFKGKL